MLQNLSDADQEFIVLPDGRIDLFFIQSGMDSFRALLFGIGTQPELCRLKLQSTIFAISFKPLGLEYILGIPMRDFVNGVKILPHDFWGFTITDFEDFDLFYEKFLMKIVSVFPDEVDSRKSALFDHVHELIGGMNISELSEVVEWKSRQINRYFRNWFGIPLKTYCNILRFRASFSHIKSGKLFPEQNYVDQPHFIKDVKRLSGVIPKELKSNKGDRFIQFSKL